MRKEEFFDKLEYLLQDIPDQDREDALDYYRDYLAEAGSGNEEAAIEDFGALNGWRPLSGPTWQAI